MTAHKAEARRALEQVRDRLRGAEPVEGLARFQLAASVEFALEQLEQIEELKRARAKAKAGTEAP